jgi:hypothetical protein
MNTNSAMTTTFAEAGAAMKTKCLGQPLAEIAEDVFWAMVAARPLPTE